jgi:signal recognition particle receptor subunit beta
MWEILSEGMLGFVVMVDSARPETFREAKSILETFRAYAPTPYVVAANKQDMKDAWEVDDLRIALRLDEKIKLLPCVATDKESVKNSLLELLYAILEEMEEDEESADGDKKAEAEKDKEKKEKADAKETEKSKP